MEALHPKLFTELETKELMRQLASAHRHLGDLKGRCVAIPNQSILVNTLALQEAKDSSAIESIVTTHDELFQDNLSAESHSPAAKEVRNYVQALRQGWELTKENGLLTVNHIIEIQSVLESNRAGLRSQAGTTLKDGAGRVVYTPPQRHEEIVELMGNLERFINDDDFCDLDPLIKMAIIHHQFESIHPFYDGNGRTGRVINVLYLMTKGLLDLPILYLSRTINRHKAEYYRLLQEVRDTGNWHAWVLFMLKCVEQTALHTTQTVNQIAQAFSDAKVLLRRHSFYSHELINHIFSSPYTKIEHLAEGLQVSRNTAIKYLVALCADGLLEKHKNGRSNYYIHKRLCEILTKNE